MSTINEMQIRGPAISSTGGTSATPSSTSPKASKSTPSITKKRQTDNALYSDLAVRLNEHSLEQCRTSVSALAGCTAGILGLTSYKGFAFYAFSMVLLSSVIYLFIRHEHRKFFTNLNHVFVNGFFSGLLTYVLFWTFLYGMVHLY